jgi:hypothetical protein
MALGWPFGPTLGDSVTGREFTAGMHRAVQWEPSA